MSIIVERLDNAIMRGGIATPAWVVNTMRAAREHIAKLEAHVTTDNTAVIYALEQRVATLEEILRKALASFTCTQRISDYAPEHWSNRAAGCLKESTNA